MVIFEPLSAGMRVPGSAAHAATRCCECCSEWPSAGDRSTCGSESLRDALVDVQRARRAEEPQQPDDDQIDRHDEVEQARHDQDENAREQGDQWGNAEIHVQIHLTSTAKTLR